jgi:glutamine synthetase
LFAPGKNTRENLQFVTFIANVMAAVHRHNALIKGSIASATNSHRLGANEAPPAIISMFLGKQLSELLDAITKDASSKSLNLAAKDGVQLDVVQIPELLIDNTDRNRTSPFAFTGNRFEFRAVGSSANCASAMIALNAAVADQLTSFADNIDTRVANGEELENAILNEVSEIVRSSKAIHFDGNGYSEEWKEEAKRRGLDTETSTPLMYDAYLSQESIEMFARTGVFSPIELQARNEVKWEMYTKKVQIEARVLGDLAINHIVPAATRYQSILLDNVFKIKQLFHGAKGERIAMEDMSSIEEIADHLSAIKLEVEKMVNNRKIANKIDSQREKAIAYHDTVIPCMENIRYNIDKLELMVDNEMWPLLKYREMLFIR